MKKLICDLCGEEASKLYDITIIFNVKNVPGGHTFEEEIKEACIECTSKYNIESRKALERVYKKLKKKEVIS